MKKFTSLAINLFVATAASADKPDYMKIMLDDMAKYFDVNGGKFDQVYYDKLQKCFVDNGDELLAESQKSAWAAMQIYYTVNGTSHDSYGISDHWGDCTLADKDEPRCFKQPYMRREPAVFPGTDTNTTILIEEPCNYVSNIAFYHSVTRICDYPNWVIDSKMVQA